MTDDLKRLAFPGDIVSLDGRRGTGKILEWSAQLTINRREMEKTHHPIGTMEDGLDVRATAFWPKDQVTVVKRHVAAAPPTDPFDEPIRF